MHEGCDGAKLPHFKVAEKQKAGKELERKDSVSNTALKVSLYDSLPPSIPSAVNS